MGTINDEGIVIRHPLAYLVEAADDIAYMTVDSEDAVKLSIVSVKELLNFFQNTYESLEEYGESKSHVDRTKEVINKLDSLNKAEKDMIKVMSQWGTYIRRGLMILS